jgi:hypothetical protein
LRRLSELPDSLGAACLKLRVLAVAHNSLAALPASVAGLERLAVLLAGSNRLTALPPGLTGLGRLSQLDVSHNQLAALPAGLAALTGLADLDASANQLAPGGLEAVLLTVLTGLTSLRLADNPGLFDDGAGGSGGLAGSGGSEPEQLRSWFAAWLGRQQGAVAPSAGARGEGAPPALLLPQLRALDVSGTGLRRVPAWLPPGLAELSVARNLLEALALPGLPPGLRLLDARDNPLLARAPGQAELAGLVQLRALALEGCPCCAGAGTAGGARGAGASPAGGASADAPAEGSAAWAAGWLAAQKTGRPWPPPLRRRAPPPVVAAPGAAASAAPQAQAPAVGEAPQASPPAAGAAGLGAPGKAGGGVYGL